ncbi:adenylate kinase [Candidatus Falkowbacteria bacterium CG10_big_fil_rev_8_21_14_0_10_39_11]|uniref:Adenylate kinase n=1 Tax=Candidatus Falkowbacteria bacterium CG10_big_fil_rev_8_21_14_0_10_39_11 TaxID=1974565 RepID=A0A2H0V6A0_9BACT|nr:MAG: adenylate kinase [Candidatus Falkowbacteria bacterium CG10_big_fil_rev_8_21_14_0_10_39_11]
MLKQTAYILVGPPGAGKGTQSEFLVEELKLKVIQPGVFLRKEAKKDTEVGMLIEGLISHGAFVPDEFVDKRVYAALKKNSKDILFDGYPRTEAQAEKLADYLNKHKIDTYFLEITLPEKLIVERINGRRSCTCGETYHIKYNKPKKHGLCDKCGQKLYIRTDSRKPVIRNRIKAYHNQTEPVIKYFKTHKVVKLKFVKINGNQSIDKVHADIMKAIKV